MTSRGDLLTQLDRQLQIADAIVTHERARRPDQPLHTCYVAAHAVADGLTADWSRRASDLFNQTISSDADLVETFALNDEVAGEVRHLVAQRLEGDAIQDLRIDFEDGYGSPSDAVEDADAIAAGRLMKGLQVRHGVRCKSLEPAVRQRSVRTLDLVVGELASGGKFHNFVVTFPKVSSTDQVRAMVRICQWLEETHDLASRTLKFELQIETPLAVVGPSGELAPAGMVRASEGRCSGLHYGTYDYSAALLVAPSEQRSDHPVADFAKDVMQVVGAATGVAISDGSCNLIPSGSRSSVLAAWQEHGRLVRRALERGLYQGWDLDWSQLPSRYAATYGFYRTGLAVAGRRLRDYVSKRAGTHLDEPATAEALAVFMLRGISCGAFSAGEVVALTGVGDGELASLIDRRPLIERG